MMVVDPLHRTRRGRSSAVHFKQERLPVRQDEDNEANLTDGENGKAPDGNGKDGEGDDVLEFKKMVNQVRATEKMLGNGKKSSTESISDLLLIDTYLVVLIFNLFIKSFSANLCCIILFTEGFGKTGLILLISSKVA